MMREDDMDAATEGLIAAGFTSDQVMEIVEGMNEARIVLAEGEAVPSADAVKELATVEEEPEVVDHRLRETGNGPTISYEESLLREYFGDPDDEGVYR